MPLEHQVRAFSFANDLDQTGYFQFLHVMGNRRRAHAMSLKQDAARHRIAASADLLEDLVAPRFGQSAADQGKLAVCQPSRFDAG